MNATIFDIQRNSYEDGPGIRTTVFFKGCNLRCAWCHNPESQIAEPQMMFYENRCTHCGKCRDVCPNKLESCSLCGKCTWYCPTDARQLCGKEYTVEELLQEISKDMAFYQASGGGVTFSGGECMLQIDALEELLKGCKARGIHTAVDTAGHVPFARFERILPYTDLFLYDIKSMDTEVHKQYIGVGNEQILDNLKALLASSVPVWVRLPIIPGVNDGEEDILLAKAFFEANGYPEKTEFLPYHALGEHKYAALGRMAERFSVPPKEKMESLKAVMKVMSVYDI